MEQPEELDLQSFAGTLHRMCHDARSSEICRPVRQGVLLASGATHRKRYRL